MHWAPGEPNNMGKQGEDCVAMTKYAAPSWWNDDVCDKEKSFVCEKPSGKIVVQVEAKQLPCNSNVNRRILMGFKLVPEQGASMPCS